MKKRYPKCTRIYKSFSDDFVGSTKKSAVPEDYKYIRTSFFFRAKSFVLYRLVATPIAFIYSKLFMRERIIGKKRLRSFKSYVLIGNHTQKIADAFTPSVISFPKKTHVIVHADNVTLPVLKRLTPALGAMPLPSGIKSARAFLKATEQHLTNGEVITVYPEAHVWSYYTGLRPFTKGALDIAVRQGIPVFSFTRVYKKSRVFGFRCEIYVDGPFFPSRELSRADAERELSSTVFSKMNERVALSTVEVIEYKKAEQKQAEIY